MASVFSGKAGRNASIVTSQQAAEQLDQLTSLYDQSGQAARTELQGGFDNSLASIQQQYAQQRGDLQGGLDASTATLRGGETAGIGSLNQGYGNALASLQQSYGQGADALNQAVAGYQPLVDQNMAGFGMYQNSLGLNGAEGNAAAQNAFQTGPGYQFAVDQATSNAQRGANRLGMAYSGNTVDATTRLASNLANQEYGNWQKNLQGFQGGAQNAVAGQSGVLGNLAQLYQNQGTATGALQQAQGRDISGLQTATAGTIANNQNGMAQNLATAAGAQGANLAQLYTGYGQSQASLTQGNAANQANNLNTYWNTVIPSTQQGMMAGQQAAANKMGAIMGGVQMGAQLLGGMAGGTGAGGFLTSLFK